MKDANVESVSSPTGVSNDRLFDQQRSLPLLQLPFYQCSAISVDVRLLALVQVALSVVNFIHQLKLVNRNSNGSGLTFDGAHNALSNPPGCVCAELESAGPIELFAGTNQTNVALLNEVW